MYLRRFGVERSGGPQVRVARVEDPERDFGTNIRNVGAESSFYWSLGPDGVPHHDMEKFLTAIEGEAATAFRQILDKGKLPTDSALPDRWPASADTRRAIAWWLAAQLIRTAPQRERLWRLQSGDPLEPPRSLRRANLHHAYIVDAVQPLAALLYSRPWGFGFTGLCLFTSDNPVQVLNSRVDDEPLETAAFWDIYVPLDPHRFLYLPGRMHVDHPTLMRDHFINLPGGLAIPLNQEVVATAHRHLIWHPDHDPRSRSQFSDAISGRRSRLAVGGTGIVLQYDAIPRGFGVERRWLDKHAWDGGAVGGAASSADAPRSEAEVLSIVEKLSRNLEDARSEFDQSR